MNATQVRPSASEKKADSWCVRTRLRKEIMSGPLVGLIGHERSPAREVDTSE
jgi:hypothetical protein